MNVINDKCHKFHKDICKIKVQLKADDPIFYSQSYI